MENIEIQEKIDFILDIQKDINKKCQKHEIYDSVNILKKDINYLLEIEQELLEDIQTNKGGATLLRLIIIRFLLQGKDITPELFETIKNNLKKDVSFYNYLFNSQKEDYILKKIGTDIEKSSFQSWGITNLCRRYFINRKLQNKINKCLEDIGRTVLEELSLTVDNYIIDCESFMERKQNFGSNDAVIILYDKTFQNYIKKGNKKSTAKKFAIQICILFEDPVNVCIQTGEDDNYTPHTDHLYSDTWDEIIEFIRNNKQIFLDKSRDKLYEYENKDKLPQKPQDKIIEGDKEMPNLPLNLILYGPPGTGKTYNTVVKAMEIIEPKAIKWKNEKDHSEGVDNYSDLKNKFNDLLGSRIEFITFHQSYSYEEFVEGIKPHIPLWGKNNVQDIQYVGKDGIFKEISKKALFDKLDINKDTQQKIHDFEALKNAFIDKYDIGTKISTKAKKTNIEITNYTDNAIRVKPVNGNSTYSIFYRYIQKLLEFDISERKDIKKLIPEAKGLASYYFAITKAFKELSQIENDLGNENDIGIISDEMKEQLLKEYYEKTDILLKDKENSQPYVLIIDEINRGNISKIFGELITLIEEDKRAGKDNAITVTLPYSGEPFSVPDNLYIIGTMNTSDRSIALLDTALRRRFDFEEMMPQEDLIEKTEPNEIAKKHELTKFLKKLNDKISTKLEDDNYKIGHAYLMNLKTENDLERAICNKIFPLLQEYFYNEKKDLKDVAKYCTSSEIKSNWKDFITYVLNDFKKD